MRKRFLRATVLFLLLTPMAVTSTTPHFTWQIYDVDGTIVRDSGSLANHTVVLLGKCGMSWRQIRTCSEGSIGAYGPFVTIMLTSNDGTFSLRGSDCGYCDSLAVGVVYPDTTIMSAAFASNSVRPTEIEKTGRTEREGFICASNDEYTYVDGLIYNYPPVTVAVP